MTLSELKRFWHSLMHRLGWNTGHVVSAYDDHGNLWIGFQCSGCGQVRHPYIALTPGDQP
jgi:hypothetical protein